MTKTKYHDIRGDGRIVVFLRDGKIPKYYVRLKLPGASGYKILSTKQSDRVAAIKVAL